MHIRILLAAAALASSAPVAFAADPVGHYTIEGHNPGEKDTYSGTVDVTKTGETYKVVWTIGGDHYYGTAIGNEQFLAISYKSGNQTGLALYGEQGNNWTGPWVYAGGTALGAERWTRQ